MTCWKESDSGIEKQMSVRLLKSDWSERRRHGLTDENATVRKVQERIGEWAMVLRIQLTAPGARYGTVIRLSYMKA